LIHWQLSLIRFFTPASTLMAILAAVRDCLRTRAALQIEVLALRHQLNVLQRSVKRRKLTAEDRFLWARLSRFWIGWRSALVMVKPETVIAWHRKGFRVVWAWKVRRGQLGRPPVSREIRKLIRQMSPRESAVGLLTASFPISVTHNLRWIGSPLAVPILRTARKVLQTDRRSAHDQNCPPKGVFLVLKLKFYTKIFAL
jgi:hypothetical protein